MKLYNRFAAALVACLTAVSAAFPAVWAEEFAHVPGCPEAQLAASLHQSPEDCNSAIDRAAVAALLAQIAALPSPETVPPFTAQQRADIQAAQHALEALQARRANLPADGSLRPLDAQAAGQLDAAQVDLAKLAQLVELAAFTHAAGCPEEGLATSAHRSAADCEQAISDHRAAGQFQEQLTVLIEELGEAAALTDAQRARVQAVREAWKQLSDGAKALTTQEEAQLAALEALPFAHWSDCPEPQNSAHRTEEDCRDALARQQASAFHTRMDALPAPDTVESLTAQLQQQVQEARAFYNTLDSRAVGFVDTTKVDKLAALEQKPLFAHLENCPDQQADHRTAADCQAAIDRAQAARDQQAAQAFMELVSALPDPAVAGPLASDQQEQVRQAREAYEALTGEAKALVAPAQLEKLAALEARLEFVHLENCPDKQADHKTAEDCQAAIDEKALADFREALRALPDPAQAAELTDTLKAQLEQALECYNALRQEARGQLTTAEQAKWEALRSLLDEGSGPVLLTSQQGGRRRFETIGQALAAAVAGDTLTLNGGSYAENLILSMPVTIQAAPGVRPQITGSWTLAAGVTLRGLDFSATTDGAVLQVAAGAAVQLQDLGIDQLGTGSGIQLGDGSGAATGAQLVLDSVYLHANQGVGLLARDPAAQLTIQNGSQLSGQTAVCLESTAGEVPLWVVSSTLTSVQTALEVKSPAHLQLQNSTLTGERGLVLAAKGIQAQAANSTLEGGTGGALSLAAQNCKITIGGGSVLKNRAAGQALIRLSGEAAGRGEQVGLEQVSLLDSASGGEGTLIDYGGEISTPISVTSQTAFSLSDGSVPILERAAENTLRNAYRSLEEAVSGAAQGSLLELPAKTYALDTLAVKTSGLTIQGQSGTVLRTAGGIQVTADDVSLEGLRITYTGSGEGCPLSYTGEGQQRLQGGSLVGVTLGGGGLQVRQVQNLLVDGLVVEESSQAGILVESAQLTLKNSLLSGGESALVMEAGETPTRVILEAGNRFDPPLLYSDWADGASADANQLEGLPASWNGVTETDSEGVRRTAYRPVDTTASGQVRSVTISDGGYTFQAVPGEGNRYYAVVSQPVTAADIQIHPLARESFSPPSFLWQEASAQVPFTVGETEYTLYLRQRALQGSLYLLDTSGRELDRETGRHLAETLFVDRLSVSGLAGNADLYDVAKDASRLEVRLTAQRFAPRGSTGVPTEAGLPEEQRQRVERYLSQEGYRIGELFTVRGAVWADDRQSALQLLHPLSYALTLPEEAREQEGYRLLYLNETGGVDLLPFQRSGSRITFSSQEEGPFLVAYLPESTSSGSSGGGSSGGSGGGGSSGGPSPEERNEAFWAQVKDRIKSAEDGDIIRANASQMLYVPAGVLRELEGREVTLVVSYKGEETAIYGWNMLEVPKNRVYYSFEELARLYEEADLDPEVPQSQLPGEIYSPHTGGYQPGVTQPTVEVDPPAGSTPPSSSGDAESSQPEEPEEPEEPEASQPEAPEPDTSQPDQPASAQPESPAGPSFRAGWIVAAVMAVLGVAAGVVAAILYRGRRGE